MNARYRPTALVVNTHHAARRALCDRIRTSFANVQLWEAGSLGDALALMDETTIDIVVIDGESSGIDGLKGTRAILDRSPAASVILMSAFNEPACRSAASRAGAMAFVNKRAINSELMEVLANVIAEVPLAPRD